MIVKKLGYALAITALVQLANLAFGVAAARLLGPTDRGILAYQVILSTIVATLSSFGISEAVTYKASLGDSKFAHINYMILAAAYGGIGALAWLVTYPYVVSLSSGDQKSAYALFAAYPFLNFLTLSLVAWFAGSGQIREWNIQRPLVQIFQFILVGLGLAFAPPSISLFVLAIILAHLVASCVGISQLPRSWWRNKPRLNEVRDIISVGTQSVGSRLSNLVRDNADKLVVGTYVKPESFAQYVVAVSFAQLFNAYSQTIIQLYFSRIAAHVNSKNPRTIELISGLLLLLGAALAIVLALLEGRRVVMLIFGDQFSTAGELAPILLAGMAFASLKALISAHALAMRQSWLTNQVEVYAVLPSILLIYSFVRIAGVEGAAYGFLVSQAAGAIVIFSLFLLKRLTVRKEMDP